MREAKKTTPTPCPLLDYPDNVLIKSSKDDQYVKYLSTILRDKSVLAFRHGWLLLFSVDEELQDDDKTEIKTIYLTLLNPVSGAAIYLPCVTVTVDLDDDEDPCHYDYPSIVGTFTSDHVSGNPISVMLFVYNLALSCSLDNKRWISTDMGTDMEGTKIKFRVAFARDGYVYGTNSLGSYLFKVELINAENDDEQLNATLVGPIQQAETRPCYLSTFYLDVCEAGGEVYAVKVFRAFTNIEWIKRVDVWRLEWDRLQWVETDSLGYWTLFIETEFSTSSFDANPRTANCVFFVKEFDRNMYCYNVVDRSLTTLPLHPKLPTQWSNPSWVMSRIRSSQDKEEDDVDCTIAKTKLVEFVHVQEEINENHGITLDDLPLDMIRVIANRLVLFDYMNFGATCTQFRLAAPFLKWGAIDASVLGLHSENVVRSPWFIFSRSSVNDDNVLSYYMAVPDQKHQFIIPIPKQLSDAAFERSENGWLVTHADTFSFRFFNPLTKLSGQLPPLDYANALLNVGFSTKPTSSDCLTVGMSWMFGADNITIACHRHGEENWEYYTFVEIEKFTPSHNSPVYHSGAFYFLSQDGSLGMFEQIGDDEPRWKSFAAPTLGPKSYFYSNHLVELNEELIAIFVGCAGEWVRVFKFSHSSMHWVELIGLGNGMIFISPSSCLSMIARTAGMENKIYFPRLDAQGGLIYYSMDTRKFHSTRGLMMTDFCYTTEYLPCCWFKPSWS